MQARLSHSLSFPSLFLSISLSLYLSLSLSLSLSRDNKGASRECMTTSVFSFLGRGTRFASLGRNFSRASHFVLALASERARNSATLDHPVEVLDVGVNHGQ